jgi:hypothetical protein
MPGLSFNHLNNKKMETPYLDEMIEDLRNHIEQQKGNFDSTVGMRQRLQTSYIVGSIPTE